MGSKDQQLLINQDQSPQKQLKLINKQKLLKLNLLNRKNQLKHHPYNLKILDLAKNRSNLYLFNLKNRHLTQNKPNLNPFNLKSSHLAQSQNKNRLQIHRQRINLHKKINLLNQVQQLSNLERWTFLLLKEDTNPIWVTDMMD